MARLTTKSTLKKRCLMTATQTTTAGTTVHETSTPFTHGGMNRG